MSGTSIIAKIFVPLSVPVAYTALRSKEAALLLLIHCLLLLPLWESVIFLWFVVRLCPF